MTRPPAGEQVGLRRTEAFVVQRSTNQPLEPAEAVVGHRLRDDVTHAVVTGTGHRAVVVRPRQDLEREVLVALEVFDQRGAATHVGLLEFGGRAVAHDGAVVPQGLVDGVVAARADEHGIAGEPHPAPAGVGERSAELVGRLDECHRKPFARSGIGACECPRRSRRRVRRPSRRARSQVPRSVDEAALPR